MRRTLNARAVTALAAVALMIGVPAGVISPHGCTGSAASKVVQARLTGKSTDTSASCVAFENAFPSLSGKVSYKLVTGSLAPPRSPSWGAS